MHSLMDVTDDALLGGRLRLKQPRAGYRAGMDAALLAAACAAAPGQRVLEAGCGPGGALLAAAARRPLVSFVGIEKDPAALALAQENIIANGLSDRVTANIGDVAAPFSRLQTPHFDAAMANPPYFDDDTALRGPHPARRAAWIAEEGLACWIAFLIASVRQGGVIIVIHRSDRLADLLAHLSPATGSLQVRPVQPFADDPAKRVLIRAVKSGRAPLRLLPPLVLHNRGGTTHTQEADAIFRGEAGIAWL